MCFFNAMSLAAIKVATRYGRGMDVVEMWKQVMAEKEPKEITQVKDLFKYRLAEGMYNIPAYTEPHCIIVHGSDQLQVMGWGLIPHSAKPEAKERYIAKNWHKNARAEEIFDKWPWRFLIQNKRCLIPSTGYFEYHHRPDKTTQPYCIHLTDRELFSMAGLWDEWTDPQTGEKLQTFVQITTAANDFTRRIHNGGQNPFRMPLILKQEDEGRWLDPTLTADQIRELLKPYPADGMAAYPVYRNFRDMNPYDKRVISKDDYGEDQLLF